MMKKRYIAVLAVFICFLFSFSATEAQIFGNVNWYGPSVNGIGASRATMDVTTGNADLGVGTYQVWCVSALYSTNTWYATELVSATSQVSLQKVSFLLNNFNSTINTNEEWIAMQAAIWTVTSVIPGFTGGAAFGNSTIVSYYNTYNTYAGTYGGESPSNLLYLEAVGGANQNFVAVVPEPGTLLLLGIGFIGLGGAGYLRRKRK